MDTPDFRSLCVELVDAIFADGCFWEEELMAAGHRARATLEAGSLINHVKFYFMHDNFTFTCLTGNTVKDIASNAKAVQAHPGGSYGFLCPAIVMAGDKEVRRVGEMVHSESSGEWCAGLDDWIECVQADPDISRIMCEAQP